MKNSVRNILETIGEDPDRQGLLDTPARVEKAYLELTKGYSQDPTEILSKTFAMDDGDSTVGYNGMVVLRGIEFYSLCEHHMLPFLGTVDVVYIPTKDVVGISKLARLVEVYARRLQCQERLTSQIAYSIFDYLDCQGVMVKVQASHFCMRMRGVGKQGAVMVTSEVLGVLREDPAARAEALELIKGGK